MSFPKLSDNIRIPNSPSSSLSTSTSKPGILTMSKNSTDASCFTPSSALKTKKGDFYSPKQGKPNSLNAFKISLFGDNSPFNEGLTPSSKKLDQAGSNFTKKNLSNTLKDLDKAIANEEPLSHFSIGSPYHKRNASIDKQDLVKNKVFSRKNSAVKEINIPSTPKMDLTLHHNNQRKHTNNYFVSPKIKDDSPIKITINESVVSKETPSNHTENFPQASLYYRFEATSPVKLDQEENKIGSSPIKLKDESRDSSPEGKEAVAPQNNENIEKNPKGSTLKKKPSRILTKELEAKYGIRLFETDEEGEFEKESVLLNKRLSLMNKDHNGENKIKRIRINTKKETKPVGENEPRTVKGVIEDRKWTQGFRKGGNLHKRMKSAEGSDLFIQDTIEINPRNQRRKYHTSIVVESKGFQQVEELSERFKHIIDSENYDSMRLGSPKDGSRIPQSENKLGPEEYKPMMVRFHEGNKIVQPKFMNRMGSMCLTELWPQKLRLKMQKMLFKGSDYVRMKESDMAAESVYRPGKWQRACEVKKSMSGNMQRTKQGSHAEAHFALHMQKKVRSIDNFTLGKKN